MDDDEGENEKTVPKTPKDMPIIDEENFNEPGPSGSVNCVENDEETQNTPLVENEAVSDDEVNSDATTPEDKRELRDAILDWLGFDDLDSNEAAQVIFSLQRSPDKKVDEQNNSQDQKKSALFVNGEKSGDSEGEPSDSTKLNGHASPSEIQLEAVSDGDSPIFKLEENNTFMTWFNSGQNRPRQIVKREDLEMVLRELNSEFQMNNPESQLPVEADEAEESDRVKVEENSPVNTLTNDADAQEEQVPEAAMETTQDINVENVPQQEINIENSVKQEMNDVKPEMNAENNVKPEVNAENNVKPEVNTENDVKPEVNAEIDVKPEVNAEIDVKPEVNAENIVKQEINDNNNDIKQEMNDEVHSEYDQARVGVIREVKNDIVQVPTAGTSRDVAIAGTSRDIKREPPFQVEIVGDTNTPIETIVISDSDSDSDVTVIAPVKRLRFDDGASTSRDTPRRGYVTWDMVRDSMLRMFRDQQGPRNRPTNPGFTISGSSTIEGNFFGGTDGPSTSRPPVGSVRVITEEDERKSKATILAVYSFPTPRMRRRSERPRILRRSRSSRRHTSSRSRADSHSIHNNQGNVENILHIQETVSIDMENGKCTCVQLSASDSFSTGGDAMNNTFNSGSAGNERRSSSKRTKPKSPEKQSPLGPSETISLDDAADESTDTE